MSKNIVLTDYDNEQVFPITTAKNVFVDENTTLDTKLKELGSGGGSGSGSTNWVMLGYLAIEETLDIPENANELLLILYLWNSEGDSMEMIQKTYVIPYIHTNYVSVVNDSGERICQINGTELSSTDNLGDDHFEVYYR